MLHCFGFFFQFILFFFFLPNYCNSTTCKTNALSPYHESVRSQRPGCRDGERGPQGKKPPPGRRGAGRRLGAGGLQPPLSIPPARGRARRSVLVAAPARGSVHPRLLWPRAGRCGAVILAGLGAGVAPRLACTKAKPSEPNTRRRSRPGGGDERVFGCVLFFGTRGGAAPPPGAGLLAAPRGAAGAAGAPSPPPSAGLGGRPLPAHPQSSGLKESVNLSAPNTSVRNQSSRNLNQKVLLGDPFQYSTEENWKKETCCLHGPRARACLLQLVPVPGGISASLCLSGSLLPALALPPRAGKMGPKS